MDGNVRASPEEATQAQNQDVSTGTSSAQGTQQSSQATEGDRPTEVVNDVTKQGEPPAAAPENPEIQRLRLELETARRRVDELARAYQAVNQDKEEFKQRIQRERERLIDVEKGRVALLVLEAIDELDFAIQASGSDGSPLAQGVKLIRENLVGKVSGTGIERLSLVGQPFDPSVAEAADMELTADPAADGTVLAEIRAGYRMKDRIIRPARVKVAKYVKPAEA